jgi:hypothetical protein
VPDERPARLPELLNGLPRRLLHAYPVHAKGRPRGKRIRDFIAAVCAISDVGFFWLVHKGSLSLYAEAMDSSFGLPALTSSVRCMHGVWR